MRIEDKSYIGKVEAFEIALQRGIEKLPRKGIEVITCYCKAEQKADVVLGKDEQGFYIGVI